MGTYNNGADIIARAYISIELYLGNTAEEALYAMPSNLSLTDEESYVLTFSGVPPVSERDGFWSVTLYGEDQFLVPNSYGIYSVGDRSNLTFEGDGSFRVLLQNQSVPPPSNWTNR